MLDTIYSLCYNNKVKACCVSNLYIAGWSSLVARRAHNPKVGGSNPSPATIKATLGETRNPGNFKSCLILMKEGIHMFCEKCGHDIGEETVETRPACVLAPAEEETPQEEAIAESEVAEVIAEPEMPEAAPQSEVVDQAEVSAQPEYQAVAAAATSETAVATKPAISKRNLIIIGAVAAAVVIAAILFFVLRSNHPLVGRWENFDDWGGMYIQFNRDETGRIGFFEVDEDGVREYFNDEEDDFRWRTESAGGIDSFIMIHEQWGDSPPIQYEIVGRGRQSILIIDGTDEFTRVR